VFPPYRQVAGSTVGVEPRTPQKLNFAMGIFIDPVAFPDETRHCPKSARRTA